MGEAGKVGKREGGREREREIEGHEENLPMCTNEKAAHQYYVKHYIQEYVEKNKKRIKWQILHLDQRRREDNKMFAQVPIVVQHPLIS